MSDSEQQDDGYVGKLTFSDYLSNTFCEIKTQDVVGPNGCRQSEALPTATELHALDKDSSGFTKRQNGLPGAHQLI